MIKVGIVGVLGYTGEELIRILLKHPKAKIASLVDKDCQGKNISEIFPWLKPRKKWMWKNKPKKNFLRGKGKLNLECENLNFEKVTQKIDLVFLALPHTVSLEIAPKFLKFGKKVIDLSADFRFGSSRTYEVWYKVKHTHKEILKETVYGLPELHKKRIEKSNIIANPGCYPTGAILGCVPLIRNGLLKGSEVIIDSKSGYSGGGRKIYKNFYKDKPFVKILPEGKFPEIKNVSFTNFCEIGLFVDERASIAIVFTAIDNLVKGASGQAVQNMNLMCGFEETEALL